MKVSPVIHSYLFNDFDFFAESISQGDLTYQQLSSGQFNGSLRQIVRKRVILGLHTMNQFILQEGSAVRGFVTFLIPGDMRQDFAWRCNQLKGDVIGILHGGMEHHSITHPNFVGMPLSFEENFISELAQAMGYEDFDKIISNKECFLVDEAGINEIRKRTHNVFINPCHMDDFWEEELAIGLIRLVMKRNDIRTRYMGLSRRRIYTRAVRFMHERVMDSISMRDVAREVGVSERNLRYAFHEVAKMSPKRFFDRLRMNQVRKYLRSGNFKNVIEVAQAFGFWHSGKFASDYRSLFVEYPSESLRSRVSQIMR